MMMLLQIDKEENGIVDGTYLQWCCACTLDEAIKRARDTEKANSNRIKIAVVDAPYCIDKYIYNNVERLDI